MRHFTIETISTTYPIFAGQLFNGASGTNEMWIIHRNISLMETNDLLCTNVYIGREKPKPFFFIVVANKSIVSTTTIFQILY